MKSDNVKPTKEDILERIIKCPKCKEKVFVINPHGTQLISDESEDGLGYIAHTCKVKSFKMKKPKEEGEKMMNNKHLFWIVPSATLIGILTGLYLAIPQTITFDYGENMLEVVEILETLYEKNLTVDNINCPPTECICEYPSYATWYTSQLNVLDRYAIFPINLTEEEIIILNNTIYSTP